jgi:hypothetical protein
MRQEPNALSFPEREGETGMETVANGAEASWAILNIYSGGFWGCGFGGICSRWVIVKIADFSVFLCLLVVCAAEESVYKDFFVAGRVGIFDALPYG